MKLMKGNKKRDSRKARAVRCSSPLERLGEAAPLEKDPTVHFVQMRDQKKAKEWK